MYDYAQEVKSPWTILLKTGGFPAVYEAKYGEGTIVFNSVLVGETLSKVELQEAVEIGQNFIYYAKVLEEAAAISAPGKLAILWGRLKLSTSDSRSR